VEIEIYTKIESGIESLLEIFRLEIIKWAESKFGGSLDYLTHYGYLRKTCERQIKPILDPILSWIGCGRYPRVKFRVRLRIGSNVHRISESTGKIVIRKQRRRTFLTRLASAGIVKKRGEN
jgi:hypothetical protein